MGGHPKEYKMKRETECQHDPVIDADVYDRAHEILHGRKSEDNVSGNHSIVYKRTKSLTKETETEDATHAIPPLGYKFQNGELVVDAKEAEVVMRAELEMGRDGKLSLETEKELRRLWKEHYDAKRTKTLGE